MSYDSGFEGEIDRRQSSSSTASGNRSSHDPDASSASASSSYPRDQLPDLILRRTAHARFAVAASFGGSSKGPVLLRAGPVR